MLILTRSKKLKSFSYKWENRLFICIHVLQNLINDLKFDSVKKYYIPKMVRFKAQTSKRAFLNSLMTQWYWNWCCAVLEQLCTMESQFILLAAICQDLMSVGHFETTLIFVADSSQKVNDEPF